MTRSSAKKTEPGKRLAEETEERLAAERLANSLVYARKLVADRCVGSGSCTCKRDIHAIFAESVCAQVHSNNWQTIHHLADTYESMLLYKIESDSDLQKCKLVAQPKHKKQHGKFYTPKQLTDWTVIKVLEPLVDKLLNEYEFSPAEVLSLKIVDPAMGCGGFLLSALSYLSDRLETAELDHQIRNDNERAPNSVSYLYDVAMNCLHGVDLDPGAVKIAKESILRLCVPDAIEPYSGEVKRLIAALDTNLRCGNSLLGVLPRDETHGDIDWKKSDAFCSKYFRSKTPSKDNESKFFHFQSEFQYLFELENPGFDVVIGNPPWEIQKPNSREFFEQKDEEHYSLSKQEALKKQQELREQIDVDEEWREYQAHIKQFSHWVSESGVFTLQGTADINAYKLFIELALRICKKNGVVSLIVPSGLYSDKGAMRLREELLNSLELQSLYGFHNSEGIFDIHRSFKFCVFVVKKIKPHTSDEDSFVNTLFNLKSLTGIGTPVEMPLRSVKKLSPTWLAIPEIESQRDVQLLCKIADNSITLKEFAEKFSVRYKREFDMTNDSHLFLQRDQAEDAGYIADQHGRWHQPGDSTEENGLLPLYEGRMIGQFDVAQKGWVHGKGRQALWSPNPDQRLMPQYLVRKKDFAGDANALKIGFLGVGSATNTRSMIAACLGNYPCGNSVPTLSTSNMQALFVLLACLNSFVFDWVLRIKLVGNNLNYFILQDCYLPRFDSVPPYVVDIAAILSYSDKHLAPALSGLIGKYSGNAWQISPELRLQLRCALDALITQAYGLTFEDLSFILKDCDESEPGGHLPSKGFWRVDKDLAAPDRQTVRTLRAYEELLSVGAEKFVSDNLLFCIEPRNR